MGQAAREAADALSWLAALGGAAAFAFAGVFAIPVKDFKDSAACFPPKGAGGEPKRRSSSVVHARNARLRSEE